MGSFFMIPAEESKLNLYFREQKFQISKMKPQKCIIILMKVLKLKLL